MFADACVEAAGEFLAIFFRNAHFAAGYVASLMKYIPEYSGKDHRRKALRMTA